MRVEIEDGGFRGEGSDRKGRVRVRSKMEGKGDGLRSERLRRLGLEGEEVRDWALERSMEADVGEAS